MGAVRTGVVEMRVWGANAFDGAIDDPREKRRIVYNLIVDCRRVITAATYFEARVRIEWVD